MKIDTTINAGLPVMVASAMVQTDGADYNTDLIWDTLHIRFKSGHECTSVEFEDSRMDRTDRLQGKMLAADSVDDDRIKLTKSW